MAEERTGAEILALPMEHNDAGATTMRAYLQALLSRLWEEGEGFGGKRPFGNSAWEYELYLALARAGAIPAEFHEDGDMLKFDEPLARELIFRAIEAL